MSDSSKIKEIYDIIVDLCTSRCYVKNSGCRNCLCREVRQIIERKAGQFLADMKDQDLLSKGAATPRVDMLSKRLPTLAEMGVEHKESQRWQRIAAIPEEEFEDVEVENERGEGESNGDKSGNS